MNFLWKAFELFGRISILVRKKDLLHFSWSCCLEKEHLKNSSIQNSLFVIIRMLDYMWLPNRYCKHLGSWKWGVLHYPTPGASFFFFIFWRLHCLKKTYFIEEVKILNEDKQLNSYKEMIQKFVTCWNEVEKLMELIIRQWILIFFSKCIGFNSVSNLH